ncbi:MAG: hypothetical protein KKE20_07275, partial [Nanoarchaeota archaeon]|nr:hypothetical protein [Nanoarchaeota archaeon]
MGDLEGTIEKTWKQRIYDHRGKIAAGITALSIQDNIRHDINIFMYYLDILNKHDEATTGSIIDHVLDSVRSNTLHLMAVSLAAYYTLHRLGRNITDEEVEQQIEQWKIIHEGNADKYLVSASKNLKTFCLGVAAGAMPWLAHYLGGSID